MNHILDLGILYTFTTLTEKQSFAAASMELKIPQTTLSQQLAKLEKFFNIQLLERKYGHLRLTDSGEKLYSHAKRLLVLNHETISAIKKTEAYGTLNIGCCYSLEKKIILQQLKLLQEKFPLLNVNLSYGYSNDLIKKQTANEFDIIWIKQKKSNKKNKAMYQEELVWLGSQEQILSTDSMVNLVSFQFPSVYRELMIQYFEKKGIAWNIAATTSNLDDLQTLISQGVGISLLPHHAKLAKHVILAEKQGFTKVDGLQIEMRIRDDSPYFDQISKVLSW